MGAAVRRDIDTSPSRRKDAGAEEIPGIPKAFPPPASFGFKARGSPVSEQDFYDNRLEDGSRERRGAAQRGVTE